MYIEVLWTIEYYKIREPKVNICEIGNKKSVGPVVTDKENNPREYKKKRSTESKR